MQKNEEKEEPSGKMNLSAEHPKSGILTSSHGAILWIMSFRCPIILSSWKSYGNVSVHSVSNCKILGPNFLIRAWNANHWIMDRDWNMFTHKSLPPCVSLNMGPGFQRRHLCCTCKTCTHAYKECGAQITHFDMQNVPELRCMPVLHADLSILHMQLACLWLNGHFVTFATFIPFLKTSGLFADLSHLFFLFVLSTLLHFHPSLKNWNEFIDQQRGFLLLCFLAVWKNCLVTSGRCTMKKRWTKQQHFCNFTWAADNAAFFPRELKVVIGQGHSQMMPTSGADLSEDVAVGIVGMGQGGKCREWHNWCISVISKDSQCGCSQSFHPPLCEKEMVLNNKLHFYLQKTQTETNSLLLHPHVLQLKSTL